MRIHKINLMITSSSLLAIGLAGPVYGQATTGASASNAQQIADIVVTAERRGSSVQTTPLSINAITGDTLQNQQITNVESLSTKLPNLSFSRNGGDARIFIRGIGV